MVHVLGLVGLSLPITQSVIPVTETGLPLRKQTDFLHVTEFDSIEFPSIVTNDNSENQISDSSTSSTYYSGENLDICVRGNVVFTRGPLYAWDPVRVELVSIVDSAEPATLERVKIRW